MTDDSGFDPLDRHNGVIRQRVKAILPAFFAALGEQSFGSSVLKGQGRESAPDSKARRAKRKVERRASVHNRNMRKR